MIKDILKGKKGIFFDLGWTLCRPASGDWMITNKFRELFGKAGFDSLPPEILERAMSKGMHYLKQRHCLHTLEEETAQFTEYYRIILSECSIEAAPEALRELVRDKVCNNGNCVYFDEAKPTLETLSRSFKLGVISDTWPSAQMQLENAGVAKLFSSITFSCDVGAFKPNEKIYAEALSAIGLRAEETVFIDDCAANLDGAARLGIGTVLIAANPEAVIPEGYTVIESVSQLCV